MMTIGQFARATGLTAKALRFYDEKGLLVPQDVDPGTAYRRYGTAQLRRAAVIKVLRQMGMSLAQVAEVVDNPDRSTDLIARFQRDVIAQQAHQRRALDHGVAALEALEQPVTVRTRQAARQHWVGAVLAVDLEAVDDDDTTEECNRVFVALWKGLHDVGNPPTGPFWTAIREHANGRDGELLACWPVTTAGSDGFAVEGLQLTRGTLPDRTEVFVHQRADDPAAEQDVLPGGMPTPAVLALLEHLGETGSDPAELRQVAVLGEDGTPVGVDVAVTTSAP